MTPKYIKVSVIIPVYNGEETIEKCLRSIANQNYDNYEIIVVDNASTDKSKYIIDSLAKEFKNIYYVYEKQKGRGAARNAGIEAVNGEIIAMTDVDCMVPKDWLKVLTTPITNFKAVAVSGFESDATGNYWSRSRQEDDWRFIQPRIKDNHIDHLDTKNFAIRADILKRLKFNQDLIACEDWDLYIRLKLEGFKVYFLPDLRVSHYHDSSLSKLYKTQFTQGYSATSIITSYNKNSDFIDKFGRGESTSFFSVKNFLLFIPWAAWQFIYRPYRAPYRVISDLAWKIGVLSFLIKRYFSRCQLYKR